MVFRRGGADHHGSPSGELDSLVVGVEQTVEQQRELVDNHIPDAAEIERVNGTLSYVQVRLPPGDSMTQRAAELETESGVRYAEPNYRGSAAFTPDDSRFDDQYAPEMVSSLDAWDHVTGTSDVTLAVLDTGVKYDHDDLAPNMDDSVPNHGRDFVNNDGDPYPDDISDNDGNSTVEAHGTHVAGILGAATDNGTGVAGISDCSILVGRVLDSEAYGYYSDWADGIQWAADQGADVINLSLGGTSSSSLLQDALQYARANGALPVAAAHNDGEESVRYPAAYPESVAVSALNESGGFAYYSNYGDPIDLTAPGSSVLSTYPTDTDTGEPGDDYVNFRGTSMATPVVAGVAGLVLSYDDTLSVDELETVLASTAVNVGLPEKKQGDGRVDAKAALDDVIGSPSLSAPDRSTAPGGSVELPLGAQHVQDISIAAIWRDWERTDTESDGGSISDAIDARGELQVSWSDTQPSVSPSVTLDLPNQYVGGEFLLTVTASNPESAVEQELSVMVS